MQFFWINGDHLFEFFTCVVVKEHMNPIVWVKSKEKGNSITQDNIYYNNYHSRIKDIWGVDLMKLFIVPCPKLFHR
jgi:hypothetical protein